MAPELPRGRFSLGVSKGFLPHLTVRLQVATLSGDRYYRTLGSYDDAFRYHSYGGNVFLRVSTELAGRADARRRPYLDLYGQVGGGMTLGYSTLSTGSRNGTDTSRESHVGYVVNGAAGLAVTRLPATLFLQAGWDYAPTIKNLVGDVHDVGGPSGQLGLRFQFAQ